MNCHHDADMTDVTIVLDALDDAQTQAVVKNLESLGLVIRNVDIDECVVEGSIVSHRVHELKVVPSVRYVRSGMSYMVDYPVGDPRNLDGPDDECDESED